MHHLVVDARTIRPGATGIGQYTAGLLAGLNEVIKSNPEGNLRVTAIRLRSSPSFLNLENIDELHVGLDYEEHPAGDLWLHKTLPEVVRQIDGDVLLSPAFTSPAGWRRGFKRLLIIPDSIVWELPENHPPAFRIYLQAATRISAVGADRLLSISPAAARRLRMLGFGRSHGVGVVPCAVDHEVFYPADVRPDVLPDGSKNDRPLLVYTASFEPRKNHAMLFEALRRIRPAEKRPRMVLLNNAPPGERARMRRLATGLGAEIFGPSSPTDIAAWLRTADAAVFPSLMEGFGLPALEAMACGTPLIASDIDSMRWLTNRGKCGLLVDPEDPLAWSAAIRSALHGGPDVERRRRLALRRSARFTWQHSAQTLLQHAFPSRR